MTHSCHNVHRRAGPATFPLQKKEKSKVVHEIQHCTMGLTRKSSGKHKKKANKSRHRALRNEIHAMKATLDARLFLRVFFYENGDKILHANYACGRWR